MKRIVLALVAVCLLAGSLFAEVIRPGPGTNIVRDNQSNTWSTGAQDFSAASSVKLRVAAGCTAGTNGLICYDSTNNNWHVGQSAADAKLPTFTVTPSNGECVTWVVSGSNYKLGNAACGSFTGGNVTGDMTVTNNDPFYFVDSDEALGSGVNIETPIYLFTRNKYNGGDGNYNVMGGLSYNCKWDSTANTGAGGWVKTVGGATQRGCLQFGIGVSGDLVIRYKSNNADAAGTVYTDADFSRAMELLDQANPVVVFDKTISAPGVSVTTGNLLDVNNTLTVTSGTSVNIKQRLDLSGDISPTAIAAQADDYNPTSLSTSSVIRVTLTGNQTMTGLQGGADGRMLTIINIDTTDTLTLANESASSSAANRFAFVGNATLQPGQSMTLWYDATSSRWRPFSHLFAGTLPAANGGTGISSLGTGVATALGNTTNGAGGFTTTDGTKTLTNTTYDAAATGNVLTQLVYMWLPAAGCINATAGSFWDLPTSNAAAAACVTGTNTQKGVLDFADGSNLSAQTTYLLPLNSWVAAGTIALQIVWYSSTTSGNVVWQAATSCVADSETDDPSFNTATTVTSAPSGTTNQRVTSFMNTVTVTGCAAGELLHLKLFRDSAHASDTMAGTARLIGVQLAYTSSE